MKRVIMYVLMGFIIYYLNPLGSSRQNTDLIITIIVSIAFVELLQWLLGILGSLFYRQEINEGNSGEE